MTPEEIKLAAALLRMAAEQFSRHGCNDFDLKDYLSEDAAFALCAKVQAWADPTEPPEHRTDTMDWLVMEYIAERMEKAA